jgi:putative phosphoribosyl transferase
MNGGRIFPSRRRPGGGRVFVDRSDAGRQLAERVAQEGIRSGVVIGLARGGVEVAAEVARALGLPLDALAVRKVGHPDQPEYAIGAVTPRGGTHLRPDVGRLAGGGEAIVAQARADADALDARLHRDRAAVPVAGRRCILVDDGLATGATMVAAVDWARRQGARTIIVAVPVAAAQTVGVFRDAVDGVVCIEASYELMAVGAWYDRFDPVSDDRACALLDAAAAAGGPVVVEAGPTLLPGDLRIPTAVTGAVIFAHGSGSSRHSPRNRAVSDRLHRAGLATLLFDLLSPAEAADRRHVFDIPLLASRLDVARAWLRSASPVGDVPFGYFGASTGAAAALWAAAAHGDVSAIVSRGGRPDLAAAHLAAVAAPTLLIVGGSDPDTLDLNRRARRDMRCITELVTIPAATHMFEEPGTLDQVADQAAAWFMQYL